MTHGTTQRVPFTSSPPGALVEIEPGFARLITPGSATLERRGSYVARISLDGYEPRTEYLDRSISPDVYGNAIFGGAVGMLTDFVDGAAYEISPRRVHVELKPVSPPPGPTITEEIGTVESGVRP